MHTVWEFIFPLRCLICNNLNEKLLCDECENEINFITNPCEGCGYQLPAEKTICASCAYNPPIFATARSIMIYNENSKEIIFKFKDATYAAKLYSRWLVDLGKNILPIIDLIIPVPLHRWRLFSRGYNQSSLLSNFISQHSDITVDHLSLSRVKNTPFQSHLSTITKRIANVKGVFRVKSPEKIKNKNIQRLNRRCNNYRCNYPFLYRCLSEKWGKDSACNDSC